MRGLERLKKALDELNKDYPRPGLRALETSKRYSLDEDWPKTYPNADRAGVYALFGQAGDLLRIGKASCDRKIGDRLGDYFGHGPDGRYAVKDAYYAGAKFIVTIPLDAGHEFEAPAVEEFLIGRLNPPLNSAGKKSD